MKRIQEILRCSSYILGAMLFCSSSFLACGGSSSQTELGAEANSLESYASVIRPDLIVSDVEDSSPEPTTEFLIPDTRAEPQSRCGSFVEGPALGLSCLHCAAPQARFQALHLARIMAASCRRNIATTILIDGTFGEDLDFLRELVREITIHGARLHLYLYFGNGPWQRSSAELPQRGFGSHIPPEEFRTRILNDSRLREEYRSRIRWAEPLITFARSRGALVFLIPMLEDNLDEAAARSLERLTLESLLSPQLIEIGRNPCSGCYSGNDESIAPGTFEDQHIHAPFEPIRSSAGLLTNDGASFLFPGEAFQSLAFTYDDLRNTIRRAHASSNSFVIWRHDYQGLSLEGSLVDPERRSYRTPTPAEEQALLSLLTE